MGGAGSLVDLDQQIIQYKPSSGKDCIANRNIGQKFVFFLKQILIFQLFKPLLYILSSSSPPPLGSVCRQYFVSFKTS